MRDVINHKQHVTDYKYNNPHDNYDYQHDDDYHDYAYDYAYNNADIDDNSAADRCLLYQWHLLPGLQ